MFAGWFAAVDEAFGPHDVDCFASAFNARLARFHSRWWAPRAERIDTFSGTWAGSCVWLAPEPALIPRCVAKIRQDGAFGSLLVPRWEGQGWWPLLFEHGHGLALDVFELPCQAGVFGWGHAQAVVNPHREDSSPSWHQFLVVRFDARRC